MQAVGPFFAAGFDWIEGLLPLLFVIFWIVSQVVNLVRRVAGDGGRPAALPVRPPRRPVAGEPPADVRVELERQIEEFLRQSRGGQQQPTPAPKPAQQRKPEPRPQQRPAAQRSDRPRAAGTSSVRRTPPPLPPKPGAPAPRLGDRPYAPLGEAGDDIIEHVNDAFAKDLGHRDSILSSPAVVTKPKVAAAGGVADELAAAIRDPAALRRLIVMREILDRPVHRWE
jgi:hypothetical protein